MTPHEPKTRRRKLISRSFFSVFSDDLNKTSAWYVDLFDYQVTFNSDWFIHLHAPQSSALELGIILRSHEIVPIPFRGDVAGGMLTIVVDDVDKFHHKAMSSGATVVEAPQDLFYGQRRMLLTDPNGLLVDVSSECPPDPDWLASLSQSS